MLTWISSWENSSDSTLTWVSWMASLMETTCTCTVTMVTHYCESVRSARHQWKVLRERINPQKFQRPSEIWTRCPMLLRISHWTDTWWKHVYLLQCRPEAPTYSSCLHLLHCLWQVEILGLQAWADWLYKHIAWATLALTIYHLC